MIKTTFQPNLWQNDSLCEVIFQRKKNKKCIVSNINDILEI